MDYDAVAVDFLAEAVVENHNLCTTVFPPDLDAEGVRIAVSSSQHEVVVLAMRITSAVDGTGAHELDAHTSLIYHQPVVAGVVEVQASSVKLELCLAGGNGGSLPYK